MSKRGLHSLMCAMCWLGLPTLMLSGCDSDITQKSSAAYRFEDIPLSTPPGITTVDVARPLYGSQAEYQWTRLGDHKGQALFQYEHDVPGQSKCRDECAEKFPPLIAVDGAVGFGPWSLVARDSGNMQWAYKGLPLYRYAGERYLGEVALGIVCEETKNMKIAEFDLCPAENQRLLTPEGWQLVRFDPATDFLAPPQVKLIRNPTISGYALADHRGHSLYVQTPAVDFPDQCAPGNDCSVTWFPLSAPALAQPVGDFEIVAGSDGRPQWAYKGSPLFTYSGDAEPIDVNGLLEGGGWQAAMVYRDFLPADVELRFVPGRGRLLAKKGGNVLYSRHGLEFRWGGRNLKGLFDLHYPNGKRLGLIGCNAECLQEWKPLRAPQDAVGQGYWETYEREDGSLQWAYKGHAMYTNVKDTPTTVSSNNEFHFIFGPDDPYSGIEQTMDPIGFGKNALYWHFATP